MALHVVTGAGVAGTATARLLAAQGEDVRIVTRSGGGPRHPRIERVAADVSVPGTLAPLLDGARTLYNTAAPAYHHWRTEFPPLAAALLDAAVTTRTDYVMLGNVYGYGRVDSPATPAHPMEPVSDKGRVRADMWALAQAAHRAGRVRVAEVRAGDFLGAGAYSLFNLTAADAIRAGEEVRYPADLGVPHSWAYTGDVARTLVAVGAAYDDPAVWGRAWHVPPVSDLPVRDLVERMARVVGSAPSRLAAMPREELAALGAADELMAEVAEMDYLLYEPFVMEAAETTARFGIVPAPLDEVLAETSVRADAVHTA